MKVIVLSSGSKGNTTYIETESTRILIDAGNTSKYICESLEEINVDPKSIDAILLTHTHIDHIKSLPVLLKHINPCVYMTKEMQSELDYIKNFYIIDKDNIEINDLKINVIKTSHDSKGSVGYIVNKNNKSIVYITDTGYVNRKYFDVLKNKDIYIMESNHDIEMLNNGRYPFELRQRILSDKGHLSNYDSAKYLSEFVGKKTKYIMLAHLSEENNTEELAYSTLMERFEKEHINVDNVLIAKQNKKTELIEI